MKSLIQTAVILCLTVMGCGGGNDGRRSPSPEQIANLTYHGIYEEPVTLTAGLYEGEPFVPDGASRPTLMWADALYAMGDVTGDGNDDAAVLLSESSGGSGTGLYLAVVSIRNGEPVNAGTVFLGDRPQVRSLAVADGRVRLDLVEHGPDDAACCPTRLATKAWEWVDGSLTEISSEVTGKLSLDVLRGTEWVLTHMNIGEPAPAEPEITLVFEEKRVAGSSGCNRYFAAVEETSPGFLRMGPVASTRKACPEPIEQTEYFYHLRLARVNAYRFWLGSLAVSWRSPDGWHGTMLFTGRPSTPPAP